MAEYWKSAVSILSVSTCGLLTDIASLSLAPFLVQTMQDLHPRHTLRKDPARGKRETPSQSKALPPRHP